MLRYQLLEPRLLFASDYMNSLDGMDVDMDRRISPLDVLVVINEINAKGMGPLTSPRPASVPLIDTDGDRSLSPLDALVVINQINRQEPLSGLARTLSDEGALSSEAMITIGSGQSRGSRVYQLSVDARLSNSTPLNTGDIFAVYVVGRQNVDDTLLDRGIDGSPIFSMSNNGAVVTPGLSSFDGVYLTIDLTSIVEETSVLKLQLINHDSSFKSQVLVNPISNVLDVNGTSIAKMNLQRSVTTPGPATNTESMTELPDANVGISEVQLSSVGNYEADLVVVNNGAAIGRDTVVVFDNLPTGVIIENASGITKTGLPYVNIRKAIVGSELGTNERTIPIRLKIKDPGKSVFSISTSVLSGITNRSPVLPAIADVMMKPGERLSFKLNGQDPDGNAIQYSVRKVSPTLPMTSLSGDILTFAPTPSDIGTFQFDIIASDGNLTASRRVNASVVDDVIKTTRLTGKVLDVAGNPIVSLRVEVGSVQAITQADGQFELDLGAGIPASDTLRVRADLYPSKKYPFIAEKLPLLLEHSLFLGIKNQISRPIYLPLLNDGSTINPAQTQVVSQQLAIGEAAVQVHVAAGTLFNQQGTLFNGKLSITEVPRERTPAALPSNLFPDTVITIQPGEMSFAVPAPLTLPNRTGYPPGKLMDLWSINPTTGAFEIVGSMQVSADGAKVETISGGIRNSSWHFTAPPPVPPINTPQNKEDGCHGCVSTEPGSSVVELHSGALHEWHDLVSYESLGQTQELSLHYLSNRANPIHNVFVSVNGLSAGATDRMVASVAFSRGDGLSFDAVSSQTGSKDFFWRVDSLNNPLISIPEDFSSYESGIYSASVSSGVLRRFTSDRFNGTRTQSNLKVVVVNGIGGIFGNGWGLSELSQVIVNPDGNVLLVQGDGTQLVFESQADNVFKSPPGDFSTFRRVEAGFQRKHPNGLMEVFGADGYLRSKTDRNGNATVYEYSGTGILTKIIDPVGLTRRFEYEGGRVARIIDPAGRITGLFYDSKGNLVRIQDPNASERNWRYDSNFLMVGETDKRGFTESVEYNSYGQVRKTTIGDGTVRYFESAQSRGIVDHTLTGSELTAPFAASSGNAIARFTDSAGAMHIQQLDRAGQMVTSDDTIGPISTVTRNSNNLVETSTDGRGNPTKYTYDTKGNVTKIEEVLSTGDVFTPTITWKGTVDGNWNNPSNWVENRLPNASDDVLIGASADVTVRLDTSVSVRRLYTSAFVKLDVMTNRIAITGQSRIAGQLTLGVNGTVLATGNLAVLSITAGIKSTSGKFRVENDGQLVINSPETLIETAQFFATKGTLTFPNLTFAKNCDFTIVGNSQLVVPKLINIDHSTFSLADGAVLSLPLVTRFESVFRDQFLFWGITPFNVSGLNSSLTLPNLETLTTPGFFGVPALITASAGGAISLPKLSIVDNPGFFDFSASGTGSKIDLPSATSFRNVYLTSLEGGRVAASNISAVKEGGIKVQNSIATYPRLSDVSGSIVTLYKGSTIDLSTIDSTLVGGRFDISGGSVLTVPVQRFESNNIGSISVVGAGSQIVFPNLTSLKGGSNSQIQMQIVAQAGGVISFPELATVEAGSWVSISAKGADSKVEIPRASILNNVFIAVSDAGNVVVPLLATIEDGGISVSNSTVNYPLLVGITGTSITLEKGSTIDLSKTGSTLKRTRMEVRSGSKVNVPATSYFSENAGTFVATGVGSSIDLPSLTVLSTGNGFSSRIPIYATDGASINFPLAVNQSPNGLYDIAVSGTNAIVRIPKVTVLSNSSLSVSGNGAISIPGLTTFSDGVLSISASVLSIPLLNDVTGTVIKLGKGSTIDLSKIGATLRRVRIEVSEGSQVTIPSGAYFAENVGALVATGAGSKIDMPNVTVVAAGEGFSGGIPLIANDGGTINLPLARLQITDSHFDVSASGNNSKIMLPMQTSLSNSTLSVVDGATVFAPNLAEIVQGTVTVSNAAVNFPLLSDINNARFLLARGSTIDLSLVKGALNNSIFELSEGSKLSVPITDYSGVWERSFFVTGSGSELTFPNLVRFNASDDSILRTFIDAIDGGKISFPKLTSIEPGYVTVTISGVGSNVSFDRATSLPGFSFFIGDKSSLIAPQVSVLDAIDNAGVFQHPSVTPLTIQSGLTNRSSGKLGVTLPNASGGAIRVAGSAVLDGELNASFVSVPSLGTTFEVLVCDSLSGTFSSIKGLGLPNNWILEPSYLDSKMTVTVREGSGEGPGPSGEGERLHQLSLLPTDRVNSVAPSLDDFASGEGIDQVTLTRTFEYDSVFSQLTKSVDENGRVTLLEIDPANGNRLNQREVVGAIDNATNGETNDVVTRYTYTSRGQINLMTDPLGRITDYDYDQFGRVVTVTKAKGTVDEAVTRFEYDPAGNRTAVIDPNGNRTAFQFDSMNRVVKTIEADPDGSGSLTSPVSLFEYDADGNLTKATDSLQHATFNRYDARSRMVESIGPDPDGNGPLASPVTKRTYDAADNVTSVTDALNKTPQYRYDARNRRIESIDPDGGRTSFAYDFDNNLVKLTDPVGNVTQFAYDSRDRQTEETDPLGKAIRYAYDGADNLTEKTDRNGRLTLFSYDDLNRLTQETWAGGNNTISYSYDAAYNLLTVNDAFSSLAFTYDALDRVKSVDNQGTPNFPRVTLAYAYDEASNLTKVTDAINGNTSATSSYSFDTLNRPNQITQSGSGVQTKRVEYQFNSLGQTTAIKRFNDLAGLQSIATSTFTYDGQNRLSLIDHRGAANQVYESFGYRYDVESRITQIVDKDQTIEYGYDKRDQLVSANYGDAARTDEAIKFDANGNRVESNAHGTAYRTGAANRLTTDGVYNYAYDAEGNLTKRTEIATGSTREFQWDHRNRLTMLSDKNASGVLQQVVRYSYDSLGRRISKQVDSTPLDTVDAAIEQFVYDGDDVILDFVDPDGSGQAASKQTTRYLRGPGIDNLLAMESASGTNWVHQDHLGSTRALISTAGVLVQSIDYDSFGKAIVAGSLSTRYLYTGRELDTESGLFYYRARYYDSSTGRFTNEDPIGFILGARNLYQYVGNIPIHYTDPTGLFTARDIITIISLLAGLAGNFDDNGIPPRSPSSHLEARPSPPASPNPWNNEGDPLPEQRQPSRPQQCLVPEGGKPPTPPPPPKPNPPKPIPWYRQIPWFRPIFFPINPNLLNPLAPPNTA